VRFLKKKRTLSRHERVARTAHAMMKKNAAPPPWCAVVMMLMAVGAGGQGEQRDAGAQWVQVGAFAPALFDADQRGVASYVCRDAPWAVPWTDVLAQHRDAWGSVTLKLRLESPFEPPFRSPFEVVWRQPASSSPCPARPVRGTAGRETADLLDVQLWDGHSSRIMVGLANVWPFAALWTGVSARGGREALSSVGAELWVCPRCRVQSSLWPTVEEACAHATGINRNPFLEARLCSPPAPPGARAVPPVQRFYAIMWEYLVTGANAPLRARMNQQLAEVFQSADTGAIADGVTLLLLAHYMPLTWADQTPFVRPLDQERALQTVLRVAPSLAVEAHAALAMRYLGRGRVGESLAALSQAASGLSGAARAGVLVNTAVGVSRLVAYAQAHEPRLVPSAVAQVAVRLSAREWARAVSVEILPRTPAYILTEALFAGGCFGGDGTLGTVQMADPEEVSMVHTRMMAMAPPGSDLLGASAQDRLTLIDIGANTGCFTLMAIDPPALHVLALEPIASTHRILAEHVRLNELGARVTVLHMAASNESRSATMCDMAAAGASGMSRLLEDAPSASHASEPCEQRETVRTEPLDAVCQEHGVDKVHMIKIDAEGSELAVLQGAQVIIERDRPEIFVEVGAEELTEGGGYQTSHTSSYASHTRLYTSYTP